MSKRWPDKHIVGLTGNIATGKSVVLELMAQWGALAVDADKVVRQIIESDRTVQRSIFDYFGEDIRQVDGEIDRVRLAGIVFSDPRALNVLEKILHPRVRELIFERISLSDHRIVVIEAIKLLEGGLAKECDEIWVTRCPTEIQLERLMNIRKMDRDTAMMRINAQAPQAQKVALADVVIDTGETLDFTRSQVKSAWRRLNERSTEQAAAADNFSAEKLSVDGELTQVQPVTSAPPDTQASGQVSIQTEGAIDGEDRMDGVAVRRAQRADIAAVLELINQALAGKAAMKREQLLIAFGERGYLIGEQESAIKVVIGWTADNQVAAIEQIITDPQDFPAVSCLAVLREIERTSNELICEVILAFPKIDDRLALFDQLESEGFEYVDPETLPEAWQAAVSDKQPRNSIVMIKQLQHLRKTMIRKLKRKQALSLDTSKT